MLTYLSSQGELTEAGKAVWNRLSDSIKRQFYQSMGFLRYVDGRCITLQRQGRIGTYVSYEGQEASQVGSALALDSRDWVFPTYRDHGVSMTLGLPLVNVLLYWMGRVEGNQIPRHVRLLPPSVPIATHLPHAVGAAWGAKLQGEPSIAVAYFGDGATSEGDFHEACNFAGVYQVPVIFFCQNNGYAISVPFSRQSASKTVAEKAKAYAFHGIQVDGNDVLAVYDVMCRLRRQVQKEYSPVLIESMTYRPGGHTTSDDPYKYRSEQEVQAWRAKDPLLRYRRLLLQEGLLSEQDEKSWEERWKRQFDQAIQQAEEWKKPVSQDLFAHVFATNAAGQGDSRCHQ